MGWAGIREGLPGGRKIRRRDGLGLGQEKREWENAADGRTSTCRAYGKKPGHCRDWQEVGVGNAQKQGRTVWEMAVGDGRASWGREQGAGRHSGKALGEAGT